MDKEMISKIRQLREHYSQKDTAHLLCISVLTVRKYETDENTQKLSAYALAYKKRPYVKAKAKEYQRRYQAMRYKKDQAFRDRCKARMKKYNRRDKE